MDLGRPESKTVHGERFVPVKAVPVDMFPYTKYCELVVCFERWDKVSKEQKDDETKNDEAIAEENVTEIVST